MNLKEIYTDTIKSRGMRKLLSKVLATHNLIYGEFEILYMLSDLRTRKPIQPSTISSGLKCEPAAVSRLVKLLHQKDLVSYDHGDDDRRQVLISLTQNGTSTIDAIINSQS